MCSNELFCILVTVGSIIGVPCCEGLLNLGHQHLAINYKFDVNKSILMTCSEPEIAVGHWPFSD